MKSRTDCNPSIQWNRSAFFRGLRAGGFETSRKNGWPSWTRTMSKGSKDPCATITPTATAGLKLVGDDRQENKKTQREIALPSSSFLRSLVGSQRNPG